MQEQKSMLDKLKEDYERSKRDKNKGHVIGFYNGEDELINETYEFPEGKFTIRSRHSNFFWWNYDDKNQGKDERPRVYKRF